MSLQDSTLEQTPTDNPAVETTPNNQGTTLTQADIDRHANAAKKEGIKLGVRDFVAELGFSSADEIKSLITSLKAKEEAEKSEVQRALERADLAEKASLDLKNQMETERQQNRMNNLRNQGLLELGAIGVKPERAKHALNLLEVDGKLAGLVDDEGTIDTAKLQAAVLAFKKEIPELFGNTSAQGTPSNSDATANSVNTKELDENAKRVMRNVLRW